MDMMSLTDNIFLIINISLWLCVAIGLIISYARGFKKTFNNLVAVIITIVLCYFLSPIVTRILCSLDVSRFTASGSKETIIEIFKRSFSEGANIQIIKGSLLDRSLENTAVALFNIPVYLVLLLVLLFTVRYALRYFVNLIPLFQKENTGTRCLALLLHVGTMIIVAFFGVGILFGVEGFAKDIYDQTKQVEEQKEESELVVESMPAEILEMLDEFENYSFFKAVSFISGDNYRIQQNFLGKVSEIQLDKEQLNLVKEKDAYLELVPLIKKIASSNKEANNIVSLITEYKDEIVKAIDKSNLVEFVMPIVVDTLKQDENYQDLNYSVLDQIDWTKEKKAVITVVSDVSDIIKDGNYDLNDIEAIVNDEKFIETLKEVGSKIDQSELMKAVVIPMAEEKIEDSVLSSIPDELSFLKDIIDLSSMNYENDLACIGYILQDVSKLGAFSDDFDLMANKDVLLDIIDQTFAISTIKGNEEKIINGYFAYFKGKGSVSDYINITNVQDWQKEITIIKDLFSIVIDVLKENDKDFNDLSFNELMNLILNSSYEERLLNDITDSQILCRFILSALEKEMESAGLSDFTTPYYKEIMDGVATIDEEIKDALKSLIHMMEEDNEDEAITYVNNNNAIRRLVDIVAYYNYKASEKAYVHHAKGTIKLSDYINNGEDVDDNIYTNGWLYEVEELKHLCEAFDATSDIEFMQKLNEIAEKERNTYARLAAISILNMLEN